MSETKKAWLDATKKGARSCLIWGGVIVLVIILIVIFSNSKKKDIEPAPQVIDTQEEDVDAIKNIVTKTIIEKLGDKTNMGKTRIIEVKVDKYSAVELKEMGYKADEQIRGVFIKMNSSENLTGNLQRMTLNKEAVAVFESVFPLSEKIGDVLIWTTLPFKDKYGNIKDETVSTYHMSRPLFKKINWVNYSPNGLPELLKAEGHSTLGNYYVELIKL